MPAQAPYHREYDPHTITITSLLDAWQSGMRFCIWNDLRLAYLARRKHHLLTALTRRSISSNGEQHYLRNPSEVRRH